jgi:rhodanese-related sulfurtransferase
MKNSLLLLLAGVFGLLTVTASQGALQPKEGWYPNLVQIDFVEKYAVIPPPEGVMLIDSRPTARKYDLGHIQGATNIPDTQFDRHADKLPEDKSTLLIFYCEGPECMLSHHSAFKAEKLGYTNIKVYPEGYPGWIAKGHIGAVSVAYIKKLMDEQAPMTLIDSRPKRRYDGGHIPGAINIPDLHFGSMTDQLPADKNAPLYFYCQGLICDLSSKSAEKAKQLGYTNIKVVPEGYPAWVAAYGGGEEVDSAPAASPAPAAAAPAPAAGPAIVAGKEAGSITVASFEEILKKAPDTMVMVDVRDAREFETGSFKGAINIPINSLEGKLASLPADKPIIYFCGAGGRSGEAHDITKMFRAQLTTYFLNAEIKWNKDGSYTITELK